MALVFNGKVTKFEEGAEFDEMLHWINKKLM